MDINKKNNSTLRNSLIIIGSILIALLIIIGVKLLKTNSVSDNNTTAAATSSTTEADNTIKETEETTKKPSKPEKYENIELLFGGNFVFDEDVVNNSEFLISKDLQKKISEHNMFLVNLQSVIADEAYRNENNTSSLKYIDSFYADLLPSLGITSVSLANNYIMEFGVNALTATIENLDKQKISHTGAGKNFTEASTPIIKEINGKTVCIISSCRNLPNDYWEAKDESVVSEEVAGVISSKNEKKVSELIEKYSAECDFVIAYMNCGDEYAEEVNVYQQYLAHRFVDAGADIVIGAFSNSIQGIEFYKNVPIIYSLGNFLAGEYELLDDEEIARIQNSMLLSVSINEDNTPTCQLIPCASSKISTSALKDEELTEFYNKINDLSNDFKAKISDKGLITEILEETE